MLVAPMGMVVQLARSLDHSTDAVKPELRKESFRRNLNVEPPAGLWEKLGISTLLPAAGNRPSKRSGTPSSLRSPGAALVGAVARRSAEKLARMNRVSEEPQRGRLLGNCF